MQHQQLQCKPPPFWVACNACKQPCQNNLAGLPALCAKICRVTFSTAVSFLFSTKKRKEYEGKFFFSKKMKKKAMQATFYFDLFSFIFAFPLA